MHYRRANIAVASILACAFGTAAADTLKMPSQPEPEQARPAAPVVPIRGQTMKQVEKQFGPPLRKLPAVGDPPITRWVYDEYTVYFERKYVIHSVLNLK